MWMRGSHGTIDPSITPSVTFSSSAHPARPVSVLDGRSSARRTLSTP